MALRNYFHAQTITLLLIPIFTFRLQADTSPFSPFNRYELSYEALLNVKISLNDTLAPSWFSNYTAPPHDAYPLQFSTDEQRMGFDAGTIVGAPKITICFTHRLLIELYNLIS